MERPGYRRFGAATGILDRNVSQSLESILSELRRRADLCLTADQPVIRRRIESLRARAARGEPVDRMQAQVEASIQRSEEIRHDRRVAIPALMYPDELPVTQSRREILEALAANQVIVVCGETGSGKTTQLPKMCLELGRGIAGVIGHTQPRRIAARAVAARLREEIEGRRDEQTEGARASIVGYKVRFTDHTSARTSVKVMTDGILLAETQGDRLLAQYDTLIIDEAHERSLNIDFLLGYLRNILPRRPDLKVVITSATIDPQRFSAHFHGAPIIEVSGRVYPVEVRYRPASEVETEIEEDAQIVALIGAVDELTRDGEGDILVFLSGERDIREAAEALRKHHLPGTCEVLPLYGRLSTADQARVFEPHRGRRIVLATNVAETSLTVPGIRAVIDTGYARISRYNPRTKVNRLPIEPISRASADQRKGRCGRLGPGICIRLYSEDDYRSRPEFTEPEILRSNLASVILQMKAVGLGDLTVFPFIDTPELRHIRDGQDTLLELGATDSEGRLTEIGRTLARLPADPRIGRMVLAAQAEQCVAEVLIIASALSVQDPRERPLEKAEIADAAHARFRDPSSDFLFYLNLWDFAANCRKHLTRSKQRKAYVEHFFSPVRMREWEEVHQQLHTLLADMGIAVEARDVENVAHEILLHPGSAAPPDSEPKRITPQNIRQGVETLKRHPRFDPIHRALLAGLLSNVGRKTADFEYTGSQGTKFSIFPGSALFRTTPKWVMAGEIVRTTRMYARTVAPIKPEWVERLGNHLIVRQHADPRWDPQFSQAMAAEAGALRSLELYANRRVPYGPVNPKAAREMFIEHALVNGEYKSNAPHVRNNRALIAESERLAAKARNRQMLPDRKAIFEFFDVRIPQGIYNAALFERWRKKAEESHPTLLFMRREDLIRLEPPADLHRKFPDHADFHGSKLPLDYKFDPGAPDDGVTLTVPIELLNLLKPEETPWLVPGLWSDLLTALIRELPSEWRRRFIPAPEFAAKICAAFGKPEFKERGSFVDAVARQLGQLTGLTVPPEMISFTDVPAPARIHFKIIDEKGRMLASGRDLAHIKATLASLLSQQFSRFARGEFDRDGVTGWTFGDLPEVFESQRGGAAMVGHPTIVDRGRNVSVCLVESAAKAETLARAGLRRLFVIQARDEILHLLRHVPGFDRLAVAYATIGAPRNLKEDLVLAIADRAFFEDFDAAREQVRGERNVAHIPVRSAPEFDAAVTRAWSRLQRSCADLCELVEGVLSAYQSLILELQRPHPKVWEGALEDIRNHLGFLLPAGFLLDTPRPWLDQFPRYLAALQLRLAKLTNANIAKDMQKAAEANQYWERYRARRLADLLPVGTGVKSGPRNDEMMTILASASDDPELARFRWMVEEFRVSLFAQELRTIVPVSAKRLDEQWARVRT